MPSTSPAKPNHKPTCWSVFGVFLRLGLTSFGGPVAHLAYFRDEFVTRRQWLSEHAYADLVALCQFLPGPASSQVGMALGLQRRGFGGALAAWAGFTLPSALALALFALGLSTWGSVLPAGSLHGLKLVAVAVVAQAVWGMSRQLCVGPVRAGMALLATAGTLWWPGVVGQLGIISSAAVVGALIFKPSQRPAPEAIPMPLSRRTGLVLLLLFGLLLLGLPLLARHTNNPLLALADVYYRVGALVFGGGHVVLPLLQAEVVPRGWLSQDVFLAGYGAAQAVPGPLFTFAAFLGAVMADGPQAWVNAAVCLLAIFLPSFLLVAGALPFWDQWRRQVLAQAALAGINAAVVGLLLATLLQSASSGAVTRLPEMVLMLGALVALLAWKWPPWLVVCSGAMLGGLML
ncbi:chromate efflux transporter [Rhodoferax sp.]|uniref:chromate efflux transporter n=1 Tax=Rhodoferax sp. TaxID=50421 RepID=UPI0026054A4C|nr:chromate efflux transporter [Rhodoferax sp.]MDD2924764.1 chromate efflux transporter [Rhodoferax sp.]